ncbi:MAG: FtsX-like permease family protein, partial [Terriglobales bacterium]
ALRTAGPPDQLAAAMRSTLHALEPGLALQEVVTMDQVVEDAMGAQIFAARLLGFFAGAALLIALVGLYGLLAFAFEQRRRELGIRQALGAGRRRIYTLVLGRAAALLGAGLAAGVVLALLEAHLLQAYLFGVSARDPVTLVAAAGLLAATGMAAAWLPARRAAAVPPTEALRAE